ncbi:hypothetical protein VTL71DRAFT_6487 [Oculimacula yallundae]|uniref:ATPase AAA-type core domain-containing protein n=1 Tax=Oculimacula yallundae TaxID=86028 RepID=A0ABR4BYM0_9HELO
MRLRVVSTKFAPGNLYPFTEFTNNEADLRYSTIGPSQEAGQVTESVDDLESTLTPEDIEPPRRMPPPRKSPTKGSPYRILCRIKCDVVHPRQNGEDRAHAALMFEDVPHWNPRFDKTSGHLTGFRPIYSLTQWLKADDPISFVVYRTYACSWKPFTPAPLNGSIDMPTICVPDSEARDFNESIEILSSELEESLLSVAKCKVECFTGLRDADSKRDTLSFDSPYLFLYHHRAVLGELSKKGDERLRREVFPLLIYLKERQRGDYKQADNLFAKKMVDAKVLKFLFCPNEVVVTKKNDIEVAFAVRYLHFHADDSVQLVCWAWIYDGSDLKRKSEKLYVAVKAGEVRSILDLNVYPLRFATEELKTKLLARGMRMWTLRTPQLVTYKGMDFLQEKFINEGRCMLDYPTYKIMQREAEAFNQKKDNAPPDYDNFPETVGKNETLSEDAAMLCPPNIHGFLLEEKIWVDLLVDNVYGVTWNKDAFKRPVMSPTTKDLVEALIKTHASASWQQGGLVSGKRLDLIAGKGLGLIMLLHGSPGTGKTLTAGENSCPYRVSGFANLRIRKVPKLVAHVHFLYLGKTWNCVLLLDEADVFLEERSLNDLKRNSLVSAVFLRTLEYYEDILILTSNRVGTFDEAFQSRIHLVLHYPKLTPLFRKKIWQNFFDILSEDKEDVDLLELKEHMDELSETRDEWTRDQEFVDECAPASEL